MRGQYIGTARFIYVAGLTAAMSLRAASGDETNAPPSMFECVQSIANARCLTGKIDGVGIGASEFEAFLGAAGAAADIVALKVEYLKRDFGEGVVPEHPNARDRTNAVTRGSVEVRMIVRDSVEAKSGRTNTFFCSQVQVWQGGRLLAEKTDTERSFGVEAKIESKCSVAPESARAKEIMALLSSNGFRTVAKVGDLSGDKPVYYHLLELDPPTKGPTR